MTPRSAVPVLLLAGLLAADPAASAEATWTNYGTLTCTTADQATPQSKVDALLSCSFKGESGLEGDFTGRITRGGAADVPGGRRVLVWTVLSTKRDLKLEDMEGDYTGITGGAPPHTLVAADRSVRLQPMTATAQEGSPPAPSLLELRVKPTRA